MAVWASGLTANEMIDSSDEPLGVHDVWDVHEGAFAKEKSWARYCLCLRNRSSSQNCGSVSMCVRGVLMKTSTSNLELTKKSFGSVLDSSSKECGGVFDQFCILRLNYLDLDQWLLRDERITK
jgi:hypothetical protein